MKSINDISDYLKQSQLYLNLVDDSDVEVTIDDKYFLDNKPLSVTTLAEFENLLEICRYWMLDKCPYELYDFVIKNNKTDYHDTFKKFHDIPFIKDFNNLQACNGLMWYKQTDLFEHIAKNNHLHLLKYCHDNKIINDYYQHDTRYSYKYFVAIMIQYGNLDLLKFIKNNYNVDLGLSYKKGTDICRIAASYGQFDILIFLFDTYMKNKIEFNHMSYLLRITAKRNHFKCFKYLLDQTDLNNLLNNLHTIQYCIDVAKNNNFEFFKYLVEKGFPINDTGMASEYNINYIVAKNGCFEILKYLHKMGYD